MTTSIGFHYSAWCDVDAGEFIGETVAEALAWIRANSPVDDTAQLIVSTLFDSETTAQYDDTVDCMTAVLSGKVWEVVEKRLIDLMEGDWFGPFTYVREVEE